jgi:chromate transport protein ChrA
VPNRIAVSSVCLHVSAAIYVALGFLFVGLSYSPDYSEEFTVGLGRAMLAFCICIALGIEIVALGLRRRKFWAWVAGLCVFALYVPSPFLPLGALGLWGLLTPGSRATFGLPVGAKSA